MIQAEKNYQLGLDIGIASVGWCVLGSDHIIDLGVRAFDKAETPEGKSLNLERRNARLLRRRLRRRAWRLLKLARTLKRYGVISDSQFFQQQHPITTSLWVLRVAALEHKLDPEPWARVIYHICKHRGFWFARKAEAESSEGGKVKQGLERTRQLMQDKGYRTVAQMLLSEFPHNQRNKQGDYSQSLSRDLLADELTLLFQCQRELGNPHASVELEQLILTPNTGLLWQQKPALSGEAMLKRLVGKCTFEPQEYRAAKHTWSAERFVWLTRLNNLRLSVAGASRPLNEAERQAVIDLPYQKASLSYKQLKSHLIKQGLLTEETRFAGFNYNGSKNPEDAKLIELKGWHTLRLALEKAGLKTEWQGLATQPALLDRITTILSIYKTDEEIQQQLSALDLSPAVSTALASISFSEFIRLSLKALQGILPPMQAGQRYDQACLVAGYHHSVTKEHSGSRYLPALDDEAPNNPVVKRALNQSRKVVNALIQQYGPPHSVHIEMARDLSRSLDERNKITKEQENYRARNDNDRQKFIEIFDCHPKAREFEKWQLYREQDGKCAYSLQALNLSQVIDDPSYSEVDHILPYSRSYDDSKNNKVLVLSRENQHKANRTPYEYLDGASDSPRWQAFSAFVQSNRKYRTAKRDRLLRKHFGPDEASGFKERNLNDTRYICRYFKNFVEQHLALHEDSEAKRCVVVSGQLTSFLRARWGMAKLRESSDRHHAIDAAVVAACSHSMVKRLADYAKHRELKHARQGFVDLETGEIPDIAMLHKLEQHFPSPWPHFADELCVRAGLDRSSGAVAQRPPEEIQSHLQSLGYPAERLAQIKPLFVSRAPKRRNSGAAHKETIYAKRPTPEHPNRVTQKVPLNMLTLADLDSLIEPERNQALYEAIRQRLAAHGGKGDKAFALGQPPLYKPTRDGRPGPLVRSVTKVINKQSGIPIRGGIAKNDTTIRVDVFSKAGKFYLVPVYVHHRVAKVLPNTAVTRDKDEVDWVFMDDSYVFCFSLYPNDLLKVTQKKEIHIGYYAGCDRSTGNINLWTHDRNQQLGKDGLIRSIGVKTALALEKFHVDVLGRVYPAKPETRRGLA